MLSNTFFASEHSERNWADYITLTYRTPPATEPCIFQVPKSLKDTKPEAYTPQNLGLGPFHHCHPELHEKMVMKKREALNYYKVNFKKINQNVHNHQAQHFDETIRPCYGGYLDFANETLMFILIVDTIYLLHFLGELGSLALPQKKQKKLQRLIPDIMMLENQIPITPILKVLQHQNLEGDFTKVTDSFDKFYNFCSKLSPLMLACDSKDLMKKISDTRPPHHLLHFMYQLVVGKEIDESTYFRLIIQSSDHQSRCTMEHIKYCLTNYREFFKNVIGEVNTATSNAKRRGLRMPEWLDKPLQDIQNAFANDVDKKPSVFDKVHPVSEIRKLTGICFLPLPLGVGFGRILFDKPNKRVYLPAMTLNPNSDVILRNLLAFEAAYEENAFGSSSKVRDHMGLMCAITKTKEDVRELKDAKIIYTKDLKDEDVVKLLKAIKTSMDKLGQKSKFVDIFAKFTNKEYDNVPVVKACNWMKKWSPTFLKIVKVIFHVLLLLLLFLQYYCDVHDCRRRPSFGAVREAAAEQHLPLADASFLSLDPQAQLLTPRKFLRYST